MSKLNIIGLITLGLSSVISFVLRWYTRKKLDDIEGVSEVYKKNSKWDSGLHI